MKEFDPATPLDAPKAGSRTSEEAHDVWQYIKLTRKALDIAGVLLVALDAEGRIVLLNRKGCEIVGYQEADLLGKNWIATFVPEPDRPRVTDALRQILARDVDAGRLFENAIVTRTGEERLMAWHSTQLFDTAGRCIGLFSSGEDITEQKLAERRQQRSLRRLENLNRLQEDLLLPERLEQKFKRITEAAVSLLDLDFCRIWVVEPGDLCDGGCVYATAADSQSRCGRHDKCLHLLASAGRYTHVNGLHRRFPLGCCKIGRIAIHQERRFLTNSIATDPQVADHQWAIDLGLVSFAGYKLHDTDGDSVGVLGVFAKHSLSEEEDAFLLNLSEITSRVILDSQARAELQETRRQAIAASEAKSDFLANMSHEIRTPMTAIMGFADLLRSPNLSPEDHHEFVETIGRNASSLLVLINDILDLSKIEAAKITIESLNAPLQPLLDDVLQVVRVRAEKKGLNIEVLLNPEVPRTIRTDPTRLRQILLNLLGNSIKFTERGGVRLSIRMTPGHDATKLRFAISDSGIGIDPDKLGVLFQPFAQADASTTRRFGGTGLGLAISKRLAQLLGGEIEVTSRLGHGSTFTLTIDVGSPEEQHALPAGTDVAPTKPMPDAEDDNTTIHGRVLLAEDSPDLQRFLSHVLRGMHIETDLAENGRVACDMAIASRIEGNPYDLILMDMQMPEMDGLQATQWLRAHDWRGPIVAVTAHAMIEHRDSCLAAGCDDYLAKPIQVGELRAMLARRLRCSDETAAGRKS